MLSPCKGQALLPGLTPFTFIHSLKCPPFPVSPFCYSSPTFPICLPELLIRKISWCSKLFFDCCLHLLLHLKPGSELRALLLKHSSEVVSVLSQTPNSERSKAGQSSLFFCAVFTPLPSSKHPAPLKHLQRRSPALHCNHLLFSWWMEGLAPLSLPLPLLPSTQTSHWKPCHLDPWTTSEIFTWSIFFSNHYLLTFHSTLMDTWTPRILQPNRMDDPLALPHFYSPSSPLKSSCDLSCAVHHWNSSIALPPVALSGDYPNLVKSSYDFRCTL